MYKIYRIDDIQPKSPETDNLIFSTKKKAQDYIDNHFNGCQSWWGIVEVRADDEE